MKRIEFLVLAAAATGFLAVPVVAQGQGDVSGRWQLCCSILSQMYGASPYLRAGPFQPPIW